jgi:7-cyano-7-deazaguanine synthase
VTVDYGQRPAEAELQAAAAVCRELQIEHLCVRADCSAVGSGDLSGKKAVSIAPVSEWWPYRNQLLVTLAASALAGRAVGRLLLGTVKSDSLHADGTPAFVSLLSQLVEMQEGGLRVEAPAAHLASHELVKIAEIPISILAWAHSCHTSNYACGQCRGCLKHYCVMKDLGLAPY